MLHVRFTWLDLTSDAAALQAVSTTKITSKYSNKTHFFFLLLQALVETQLLRVTNLGSAILSVYLDSASDLPQARVQSKPDPFAILSVGKISRQTGALRRTDQPVWEQGFTFLVGNPENDTLQVKIIDQKTEKELGQFTYILSTLLNKNDLQVVSQPFQLHKSGPNSKITMSLALKILKRSANEPADTPMVQRQGSQESTIQRQASKTSMIQRQPSQASQKDVAEVKNVKLAEFPKVAEVVSELGSGVEQIVEKAASSVTEFISNEAAYLQKDEPTSELRRRPLSAQSAVSSYGLGRIQIGLQYSVDRQRLSVTVHKIM